MKWFFLVFLTLSQALIADPFYYGEFTEKKMRKMKSHKLRNAIHKILAGYHIQRPNAPDIIAGYNRNNIRLLPGQSLFKHIAIPYRDAKAFLYKNIAPLEINGQKYMKTIYCNQLFAFPKFYKNTQQLTQKLKINAEHLRPRSTFSKGTKHEKLTHKNFLYQVADLHHIYPAKMIINNTRQSYMFAEVHKPKIKGQYKDPILRKLNKHAGDGFFGYPKVKRQGYDNEIMYEPSDEKKSEIARAVLYECLRYNNPLPATTFYYLKHWHIDNPPSEFEKRRNDLIFDYQLVRNLLIDRPWVIHYLNDSVFLTFNE